MAFVFSDCILDERTQQLLRGGHAVEVQPKVFDLLVLLAQHRGRIALREDLERALWNDIQVGDDSLRRLVKEARRAIGDDGTAQRLITTIRGRGYRLAVPVEVLDRDADGSTRPTVAFQGLIESLERRTLGQLEQGGGLFFVLGGAGSGKRRITLELRHRLERAGTRSLSVRPALLHAAPPFEMLAALSRRIAPWLRRGELDEFSASDRRVLEALTAGAESGTVTDRPSADPEALDVALAVASQLRRCTDRAPLLCVLHDLHRADLGSLAALELLSDELADAPVVFLASTRPPESAAPAVARLLDKLLALPGSERWPIPPLARDETALLVGEIAGRPLGDEVIESIHDLCQGTTVLVEEFAREIAAAGTSHDLLAPDRIEAVFERVVRRRLGGLDGASRSLLRAASALGSDIDVDLLTEIGDRPRAQVVQHLREAVESGLLEGSPEGAGEARFRAEIFQRTLYEELCNRGEAPDVHRRIGDALEERHGVAAAPEIARHDVIARGPNLARGVRYARIAGERAGALAAWSEAAALFRSAAEAEPDHAACDLWTLVADAERRSEGIETARATYRKAIGAASAQEADDVARAALGFADRPSQVGSADETIIQVLRDALARGPSIPGLGLLLRSRLAAELRYEEPDESLEQVKAVADEARGLGDPSVLGQVLDDQSFVQFAPADPSGWLALNGEIVKAGLQAGSAEIHLSGIKGRVTEFLELGDLDAVTRELAVAEELGRRLRSPYAAWFTASVRATLAFLAGRFEEGRDHAERAARDGARTQSPDVLVQAGAHAFYQALEADALAALEPAVLDFRARFPGTMAWRAAHAVLLADSGRTQEASDLIDTICADGFAAVPRDRGWLLCLGVAAEVVVLTRERRQAALLYDELLPFRSLCIVIGSGSLFYGCVELWLGRLATTLKRHEDAHTHLAASLAVHERMGALPWTASSLAARADLWAAANKEPECEADRRAALAIAEEVGLSRLAKRLRPIPVVAG